jgi:uncharacterized membrane protein YczE
MNLDRFLKSYIFYLISALGISLTIKAQIGVGSFNSMNVAIADASQIKIGTITTVLNLSFLLLYMRLTHFRLIPKYLIQGFSVMIFGVFINFFTYDVLGFLEVSSYLLRILLMVVGTTISGMSVGMIISYNAITFPIESVCKELSDMTSISFMRYRYGVDLLSIAVSLLVSFSFNLPLYVREGTLISFVLLSSTMSIVKSRREAGDGA